MSDTNAYNTSFVRTEFLEQSPPPVAERGIVKWLRENLFSSVPSGILTIAAIVVIYLVLSIILPWLFGGVWATSSLSECRNVLQGDVGGCFSVLTERWNQLLYGFKYPNDQYWRPNLALLLFLGAAAPILFFDLPRKLLIFSAIYPFLAFWLIWGGAFWLPLLIVVGFVAAYFVYKFAMAKFGDGAALVLSFLTVVLWLGFGLGAVSSGIDRSVGAARMDAQAEAVALERTELAALTETLEARSDVLEAEIEAIIAPLDAAETPDPDTVAAIIAEAYPLRTELRKVQRDLGNAKADLTEATNLERRIAQLPDTEAGLPGQIETATSLRAALPDTVAAITTDKGLEQLTKRNREEDLGISTEDLEAVETAIEAETDVIDAERTIARTYADVARIGLEPVASRDLGGFMLNMMLGVTCVSLSVPLGIVLALGRQSSMPLIKWICVIFIEFIRGVPLITLLFVASVMLAYFFPPGTTTDLFLRVVIMITMFSAAYIAEVIRGGLAALPKGQFEAGDSLGLNYAQAMRLIILPQALKISIPGIVNVAVGLFKDTTLVSVISMFDLVGMIRGPILAATEWSGVYWELLGFAAVLFFVVCYGISQYSQWLERRLATDHR